MKIETTTPKGVEGHGISYSDERLCGKELSKLLPKDWTLNIEWCQILMADVQYQIEKDLKIVKIQYNQNLRYWTPQLLEEIKTKATPSQA